MRHNWINDLLHSSPWIESILLWFGAALMVCLALFCLSPILWIFIGRQKVAQFWKAAEDWIEGILWVCVCVAIFAGIYWAIYFWIAQPLLQMARDTLPHHYDFADIVIAFGFGVGVGRWYEISKAERQAERN